MEQNNLKFTFEEFVDYRNVNLSPPDELLEHIRLYKSKVKQYKNKYMNTWKNKNKMKVSWILHQSSNTNENERIVLKFKSSLNKISNSNYDSIIKEILSLEIKQEQQIIDFVDIIFNKSLKEGKFCSNYAKLCSSLSLCYILKNDKKIYFRDLLLNKCQVTFDKILNLKTEEDIKKNGFNFKDELYGCMNFFGELYTYNVLDDKILYGCLVKLLINIKNKNLYAIYLICELLLTSIKKIRFRNITSFNSIIDRLEKLSDSGEIELKESFAIKDIIEME
jgi:predicted transcriptional regulator